MSQALPEKVDIERKDHIPESDRTEDRDKAAKVIDEMWPAKLQDIAEEAGYSPQHIRNVVSKYYRTIEKDGSSGEITITIPSDVENPQDYLKGLTDAMEAQ